jgi:hypothetical protein
MQEGQGRSIEEKAMPVWLSYVVEEVGEATMERGVYA